jgi:hypothetical protein
VTSPSCALPGTLIGHFVDESMMNGLGPGWGRVVLGWGLRTSGSGLLSISDAMISSACSCSNLLSLILTTAEAGRGDPLIFSGVLTCCSFREGLL